MAIGTEVGRKLSVHSFGWEKAAIQELVLANKGQECFLARFVGVARGVKPYAGLKGDTQYGLIGEFEGTSGDGETKTGTVLYLPGYVQDAVVAMLGVEEVEAVKIGYDVYAFYDKDTATSYVFSVRNLIPQKNEHLEEVRAEIAKLELPKLPAPTKK